MMLLYLFVSADVPGDWQTGWLNNRGRNDVHIRPLQVGNEMYAYFQKKTQPKIKS